MNDQDLIARYLERNPTPAYLKHTASASASNALKGQANRADANRNILKERLPMASEHNRRTK